VRFLELFGRSPDVVARAPGRVNLIGEHTDYNAGYVLPVTIPQETQVEVARTGTSLVRAWSTSFGGGKDAVAVYPLGEEAPRKTWIDYVQGVTAALRGAGFEIGGFDLRIESSVPPGGGVSSSAALLVAVFRALREAFGLEIDPLAMARLAQRAENELVGAPVGIMDQIVCSVGKPAHALFLDTLTLAFRHIPLPAGAELVVINSNIHHEHAAGAYRTRRLECEEAASRLGVATLRECSTASLPHAESALAAPLFRRVRHVVTENARVLEMVSALGAGDLTRCGHLLREGHASLRDDFEVSVPEIDLLVEVATKQPGVFGARLTGGGFGGSIVALATPSAAHGAAQAASDAYRRQTGRKATILLPR
jgi:galactokinase